MPDRPKTYTGRPAKPPATANAPRPTAAARGYGSRWQKFRKRFLAENPLCVACHAAGRIEPATDVDHVTPHRGDVAKFWAGPFQSLCKRCHSRKTAKGG